MIVSNLRIKNNNYIAINPVSNGEPRKIITEELKKIENSIALISLVFVGRRLITKENCNLLKGRRHRIFWGLKKNNKIYIKFGWHKLKNFNDQEKLHLAQEWNLNFFEQNGKYLIEKSGGTLSPDNLLYEKTGILFKDLQI